MTNFSSEVTFVGRGDIVMVIAPEDPVYDDPAALRQVETFLAGLFPDVQFIATTDFPFRASSFILTAAQVADRRDLPILKDTDWSVPDHVLTAVMAALNDFDPREPRRLH